MLFSIVQLDTVTITKLLTRLNRRAILIPLSQKTKDGIQTPSKGHNRPLSKVVFLCPSITQAALCRVYFVMVGCIEQPLKRLAGSFAGSLNLMHPTAQRLRPMGGGYSPFQRNTAMRNNTLNPAAASSLIAEIPGTLALKFSKMGALL